MEETSSVEFFDISPLNQESEVKEVSRRSRTLFTSKLFLLNLSLLVTFESALYSYANAVQSTLEKRFGYSNEITRITVTFDTLGILFSGLIVGHLGNKHNRPQLLGIGCFLKFIACILWSTPYLVYGSVRTHKSHGDENSPDNHNPDHNIIVRVQKPFNRSHLDMCDTRSGRNPNDPLLCTDEFSSELSLTTLVVFALCLSNLLNGISYSFTTTLGLSYLDDNLERKEKFPLYIGILISMKFIGPFIGHGLASLSLLFHENPFKHLNIGLYDPHFIGAWWIGFMVLGISMILISVPMHFFPPGVKRTRLLRRRTFLKSDTSSDYQNFGGPWTRSKRLVRNPLFLLKLIGFSTMLLSFGYLIFLPKYLRIHFRRTPSGSVTYSGLFTLLPMSIGALFGSLAISKYQPRPKVLLALSGVGLLFTYQFIFINNLMRCEATKTEENIRDLVTETGHYLTTPCSSNCNCNQKLFQPICSTDGLNEFFSPCQAGCTTVDNSKHPQVFLNCACLGDGAAHLGVCPKDCGSFFPFLLVCIIFGTLISSVVCGDLLIGLRSIHPGDKTFAIGLANTFLSLFAWLPEPMIYGSISNSSCGVWTQDCGKSRTCTFHDINHLRSSLHWTTYALGLISALFSLICLKYHRKLGSLYNNNNHNNSNSNNQNSRNNNSKLVSRNRNGFDQSENCIFVSRKDFDEDE